MEGPIVNAAILIKPLRVGLLAFAALLAACAAPYPAAEPPMAVVPPPQLQAGDTWVYVQINGYNGLPEHVWSDTLRPAPPGFVVERRGDKPTDVPQTETIVAPWREVGETTGSARRAFSAPLARIPFPIAPGQAWREESIVTNEYGVSHRWQTYGRALGWEKVSTPAGQFVALRIERHMNLGDYDFQWSNTEVVETYWYAPEVKRWVRLEHRYERVELFVRPHLRRNQTDWIIWELQQFRPAQPR